MLDEHTFLGARLCVYELSNSSGKVTQWVICPKDSRFPMVKREGWGCEKVLGATGFKLHLTYYPVKYGTV